MAWYCSAVRDLFRASTSVLFASVAGLRAARFCRALLASGSLRAHTALIPFTIHLGETQRGERLRLLRFIAE